MKKILTLILCWLLAFSAMAETTFKVKTAASVAGGYVTSLNKVDGSFEDGASDWSASVGTIVPTASTELQGNFKGVWAGTGTGTLDLQWTATASNTYEASAQVNVNGEDDVYVCAYVGTEETGCKLIPALTKIQKVSAVADSVLSSAFYLRLKHTGSDAFSVDVDDGKIEPWTPQAVNLVEQESVSYSGYSSGTNPVVFKTKDPLRSNEKNLISVSTVGSAGTASRYIILKKSNVTVVASFGNSASAVDKNAIIYHYDSSGSIVKQTINQEYANAYQHTISMTTMANAGDYFLVSSGYSILDSNQTNFSITATAISENITQLWNPSDRIGETIYLPQNIAPKGFISAMGSSIGKTSGTYQGDTYYNLYKVLWNVALNTAGQPYYLSSAKGTDALTDWNAGKTITIDESGLFTRAFRTGVTNGVGQVQDDAFQDHKHDTLQSGFGTYGGSFVTQRGVWGDSSKSNALGDLTGSAAYASGSSGTPRAASETRPVNVAKYVFIRYATSEPTLLALPTRSEVFSANVSVSGSVSNATQNFVTSCTNATPSVCSLWSSFGVAPICWAHTLDITKRAEVTATTATAATVARTDTSTAFNLFCHLK